METIIAILQDKDRSPAWLCRQAGISHSLFTLMKNGDRAITESTKDKFSEVLGIRKEILLNNEPKGE